MLPATTFTRFWELALASDDGAGAQCEMVHDFLKERGSSEKVEQMVHNKLCKIRDTDILVAGLCHPSQELLDRVLSEMKLFRLPPDLFAQTDGALTALKGIAEDHRCEWYNCAAAILSLVQSAKMDHSQMGTCKQDTLEWVLDLLLAGAEEDIYFALVTSLGTCLKGIANHKAGADCIVLAIDDEQQVLGCLNLTLSRTERENTERSTRELSQALADLRAYSRGLIDWVLDRSLNQKGEWPLRHVLLFCDKSEASADNGRAARLCKHLLRRVHAASNAALQSEHEHVLKSLGTILAVIGLKGPSDMLHFLEHGEAHQRVRVLCVAAELNLQFARPIFVYLARALLSHVFGGFKNHSLLTHVFENEYALRRSEPVLELTSVGKVSPAVGYLQIVMEPAAQDGGAPQQVAAELKDFEIRFEEERKQEREQESRSHTQTGPTQESEQESKPLPRSKKQSKKQKLVEKFSCFEVQVEESNRICEREQKGTQSKVDAVPMQQAFASDAAILHVRTAQWNDLPTTVLQDVDHSCGVGGKSISSQVDSVFMQPVRPPLDESELVVKQDIALDSEQDPRHNPAKQSKKESEHVSIDKLHPQGFRMLM